MVNCWLLFSNLFYSIILFKMPIIVANSIWPLFWTCILSFLTCRAYCGCVRSDPISWPDPPLVLMADPGCVKLPNKEPDCSVNVLLPVGVTAPEWGRMASAGRNPHIRAIAGLPRFHLARQLARQSASSELPWPMIEGMDFTKAVRATWHLA